MRKRKHIFAIIFILFALCISPSFSGGVGKAKNHFSQIVPNDNLQYCVVNHKFSFSSERWKEDEDCFIKEGCGISHKICNGCRAEINTPGIRS